MDALARADDLGRTCPGLSRTIGGFPGSRVAETSRATSCSVVGRGGGGGGGGNLPLRTRPEVSTALRSRHLRVFQDIV